MIKHVFRIDLTDGSGDSAADRIMDLISEGLSPVLPDYFGRNLDALYDVLTSLAEPTEIVFSGRAEAAEDLDAAQYLGWLEQVFRDAAEENPCLTARFE